ncbi:hypothetical protein V2A60_001583 [Cordyceps javanica]
MRFFSTLASTLVVALSATSVTAVPHDKVKGYPEKVTEKYGNLYKKYKPFLEVVTGCVPFPAVQDDGGVSGGLKNTGAMNGHCSKSDGQVYVRGKSVSNDLFGIMYAWYMPKDQNVDGPGNLGHRHEWENIIVWLSSDKDNAEYKGVSYSGHGGYSFEKDKKYLDGSRPKIMYLTKGKNHELEVGTKKGGEQPMIAWESMSDAARSSLNTYDFGKANCGINDKNFQGNLDKAKP